jgi:cobalt-zinc-cadmium efflux system outer membrane protein
MYSIVLLAVLAADPMTLAQIEAEAIANNPEIASSVQQTRIAQSRLASALSLDDPQFGYRAWGMPFSQPWNLNQTQHMFMLSQNVPGKGKRELKYLIASDDADIQIFLAEAKKLEILAMARQAFYRLLRSRDQIRIHHDQVELAAQTIEATRIQYVAGKAAQKDVLEAGVTYSRLAEHLIMFEREADSSRAELNTLMGRLADQPLEVEGAYAIVDALPSQEELEAMAALHRPELLALEAMQKQGKHKMQLAQKGLSPDFSIAGGYMLMPAGSMNRNGWLAEFSMTLPWLNRGKHDAEARQALEETDAALAQYQKQRLAIAREIRDAVIRNEAARKILDLYRSILRPDLDNVTRAATVAYQTNQAGLLSVLQAQNMSIEAEYVLFEALSDYERSLADLERAIGAPLPGERRPL